MSKEIFQKHLDDLTKKPNAGWLWAVDESGDWYQHQVVRRLSDEHKSKIGAGVSATKRGVTDPNRPKTLGRWRQYKAREAKQALKKPFKADDPEFANWEPVVSMIKRIRSVKPNFYTVRLNKHQHDLAFDLDRYRNCLPNYRTFQSQARFYSEWSNMPRPIRQRLFDDGRTVQVDLRSFHFRAFRHFLLNWRGFDKIETELNRAVNSETGELGNLNDYFAMYGVPKFVWKLVLNAMIHSMSLGNARIVLEWCRSEFRLDLNIDIPLLKLVSDGFYILGNGPVTLANGKQIKLRTRNLRCGTDLHVLYSTYEVEIIEHILSSLPDSIGKMVLNLHDGFYFQLNKRIHMDWFQNCVGTSLIEYNTNHGSDFEASVELIQPMSFDEIEGYQKSKAIGLKIQELKENRSGSSTDETKVRLGLSVFELLKDELPPELLRFGFPERGESTEDIPLVSS